MDNIEHTKHYPRFENAISGGIVRPLPGSLGSCYLFYAHLTPPGSCDPNHLSYKHLIPQGSLEPDYRFIKRLVLFTPKHNGYLCHTLFTRPGPFDSYYTFFKRLTLFTPKLHGYLCYAHLTLPWSVDPNYVPYKHLTPPGSRRLNQYLFIQQEQSEKFSLGKKFWRSLNVFEKDKNNRANFFIGLTPKGSNVNNTNIPTILSTPKESNLSRKNNRAADNYFLFNKFDALRGVMDILNNIKKKKIGSVESFFPHFVTTGSDLTSCNTKKLFHNSAEYPTPKGSNLNNIPVPTRLSTPKESNKAAFHNLQQNSTLRNSNNYFSEEPTRGLKLRREGEESNKSQKKTPCHSYITTILFFCFLSFVTFAQDLEKIGKKDMLKITGGLNYSSVFYNAQGIQNRRQPFTYFASGNITGNIAGISLPFTFNYSNNQVNYTQPYNIQSFNPSYKWIKGYAGITSMNFSQYTMANHIFAGAGVELSPKNFKFAALYGRFKKASEFDFENNSDINMSYKRMGYGAYAGYEKNGQSVKLIYFSAKDNATSLAFVPINTNVTPMENTVISLAAKTTLYKQITLEGEYALSGLTRNILSPEDINAPPKNQLPLIFSPNATSQFFAAYKTSLGYRYKIFGINFNYERIAPDYKTLGAYYFNNDLENFTVAPSLTLLQGKLNFSANTGLQKNNLNNDKLNTTKRWVGSVNISYAPNKNWNFLGSYSNFSSYTKQRPQNDPFYKNTLDTLNFYQLSQSGMGSATYNFGKAKTKQNIMLSVNYQVAGQNQGAIDDPGAFGTSANILVPTKITNGNLSHNLLFTKTKTSITTGINANYSQLTDFNTLFFGPTINLGQAFLKNLLKVSVGSTYNQVLINNLKTNEVFNHRLSASYSPKMKNEKAGKFGFTLSTTYIQKLKSVSTATAFSEFTGNVGLNYNF